MRAVPGSRSQHLRVVKRPRFFRLGSTVTSITNISGALALVVYLLTRGR
jgi:hypothetical protein